MAKCSKCGQEVPQEMMCSCEPQVCYKCCSCGPECTCGCQEKKKEAEEAGSQKTE